MTFSKKKPTLQALESLSCAHYDDAWVYESRYQSRDVDIPFYVDLAKQAKGPCLELGAGTGRISLPLLRAGVSLAMIERSMPLREKLCQTLIQHDFLKPGQTASQQARVLGQDFLEFNSGPEYALVIAPFHCLSHVLNTRDLVSLFKRIRQWIKPQGLFAFDIPYPDLEQFLLNPKEKYPIEQFSGPDDTHYFYSEVFNYLPFEQIQYVSGYYDVMDNEHDKQGDPLHEKSFVLPLVQRHYFPQEIRFILESCGYHVHLHAGGFDKKPLCADARSQVIICQAQ